MEYLRKYVSMLVAFSLAAALLTGVPAGATGLDDAAATGDTATEEGAASAGIEEDDGEEADVMTTLTGEADPDLLSETGDTTGETSDAGNTTGETTDTGDTGTASDAGDTGTASDTSGSGETSGESGENETPSDAGENETPSDTGENETPSDEEEAAAEGETPVEEETASSGEDGENGEEESALPFADVPSNHWSYPFVLYAYEHDLVRGVSETAFNPTGVMTRAAFVTVLYRLSKTLEADMSVSEEAAFSDIDDINKEFQSAILWAASHGIVTGRSDGTFAPRENVTRQQMCAILVRYLRDYLRYDLSAYAGSAVFADENAISDYAKEAVSIAQQMDIISGREVDGVSVFDPAGSASRAAVVKVLSIAVQQMPDLSKQPEPVPADDAGATDDSGETSDAAETSGTDDSGATSDTGDSAKNDTGDTKKASSGGSSSGSSRGSSGGGGSGGSGSSGGSGGSYGGSSGSDTGNTITVTPKTEPANAAEIFGYVDELLAAYDANPPENAFVKSCMDILIRDFRSMKEARSSGTVVDADYFKAHYQQDLDTLLDMYNNSSGSETLALMNYAKTLLTPRAKFLEIMKYFGIDNLMEG